MNFFAHYFCLGFCLLSIATSDSLAFGAEPSVIVSPFGQMEGGELVQQFTMRNSSGMQVRVIEFGATITEIAYADRHGKNINVVLAMDSLGAYVKGGPAASVIGRYANRIRNGTFSLDGMTIQLSKNAGDHHIHGGKKHFGKLLWKGTPSEGRGEPFVTLKHTSPDGEEGFPGTLEVSVTYTLTEKNELKIQYAATTDKPTVLNLTNHAYFNLSGAGGDVLNHELQIESDQTTIADSLLIPTGDFATVDQTALDFRNPHRIGERIKDVYDFAKGYDHNFVVRGEPGKLRLAARVLDPKSGRVLTCFTTEPGIQFFTANGFNNNPFPRHGAFCLETQHYPDSPNHPEFPSTIVRPGVPFQSTTVYQFTNAQ